MHCKSVYVAPQHRVSLTYTNSEIKYKALMRLSIRKKSLKVLHASKMLVFTCLYIKGKYESDRFFRLFLLEEYTLHSY